MNRNQGKRTLSKFLALTLTMALSISLLTGAKVPEAQAASFGPADADAAIRAFNAKFWDPQAKYYWADSNRGSNYQASGWKPNYGKWSWTPIFARRTRN
ncbi:hypothetical protein HMSSN139_55490 [Paenibacillus sp. HMSSN-139]|nr:hypothetical protein HMSSN139_55490 [Paenibacillus sp. HMSSN-139]